MKHHIEIIKCSFLICLIIGIFLPPAYGTSFLKPGFTYNSSEKEVSSNHCSESCSEWNWRLFSAQAFPTQGWEPPQLQCLLPTARNVKIQHRTQSISGNQDLSPESAGTRGVPDALGSLGLDQKAALGEEEEEDMEGRGRGWERKRRARSCSL